MTRFNPSPYSFAGPVSVADTLIPNPKKKKGKKGKKKGKNGKQSALGPSEDDLLDEDLDLEEEEGINPMILAGGGVAAAVLLFLIVRKMK